MIMESRDTAIIIKNIIKAKRYKKDMNMKRNDTSQYLFYTHD